MGRNAPMNPSPSGKPSVSSRGTTKHLGAFDLTAGKDSNSGVPGSGVRPQAYGKNLIGSISNERTKSGGKNFSLEPTSGTGYRQVSSKG